MGEVTGNGARFEFALDFEHVTFRADVYVSSDASRMAGAFTDAAGQTLKANALTFLSNRGEHDRRAR